MKRLYVIGNGFDIAHNLKTGYWDFRIFLEKNYYDFLNSFEKMYGIETMDPSEYRYSESAQKRWNDNVYDELWSEFENNLGHPDIDEMLEGSKVIVEDLRLDGGNIGIVDTMNQYWKNQYGFIEKLKTYLKEWIETIDTNHIKPIRKSLVKANSDMYLSFNYTDTLERVYRINRVMHIHGGVKKAEYMEPIIGHCNQDEITKCRKCAEKAEEQFEEGETSIQNAVANYLEEVYKDTNYFININIDFFNQLKDIDTVIIIGWSAGKADLPYLKVIKEYIAPNAKWQVYWYDKRSLDAIQSAFRELGIDKYFEVKYYQSDDFWKDTYD